MRRLISLMEAILLLTGALGEEELEESIVERFERYASAPLHLNTAGRTRLLESGLLSEYQVAVLLDHRQRSGTIRSYTELALLDGFGERTAEALRYFTTLEDEVVRSGTVRGEAQLRGSLRARDGTVQGAGGAKVYLELPERAGIFWGTRYAYGDKRFSPGSFNAEYRARNGRWKLLAGDYHARFGQGLCCWSGFSLSGFGTTGAFGRQAQGVTASHSFSAALRGAAASGDIGPVSLSGGVFIDGLRERMDGKSGAKIGLGYCANVVYRWRWGHAGLSAAGLSGLPALSTDWRIGGHGLSWSGEAAWDFAGKDIAAYTSLLWKPRYGLEAAMNLRYYGKEYRSPASGAPRASGSANRDEAGGAVALGTKWGSISYDLCTKPSTGGLGHKAVLTATQGWLVGPVTLKPALRAVLSHRSWNGIPLRTDLRGDIGASYGKWALNLRYNTVFCRERSWLAYAETGYDGSWLRFALFKIDNWDDRIFVYERDLRGSFSVPAYYGRGWSLSLSSNQTLRCRRLTHKFGLRASYIYYYPSGAGRSSVLEAKLQYSISFR